MCLAKISAFLGGYHVYKAAVAKDNALSVAVDK